LAFPPKVLSEAWVRSMAACECRLDNHQHAVPCGVSLRLANRGVEGEGGWEAHHIVAESEGGSNKLDNCAIVCLACHSKS
jgi:5-methylcytosine-specific restriction endonuclease McrA